MKILIIGADGQLGSDLCKVIPEEERVSLTIKDINITDRDKTRAVIKKHRPNVVINTAGYHEVDLCEDEAEKAFAVNAIGAKNLAEACRESDAALAHISTDYVFDGGKNAPYIESDCPNPSSVYGISKLAGELHVKYLLKKYFIVRSSGLYGTAGCLGKGGGNFVENMLKLAAAQPALKVVNDEVVSPTYSLDLAGKLNELVRTENYGVYHIVNHGECSWYEFSVKIFELLGRKTIIHPVDSSQYKAKARRPKYSVLQNAALGELGLDDLRPWQEALKAYLAERGHLRSR